MKAIIEGVVTEFCVAPQSDPKPGDLCLVSIDGRLTVGRYYTDSDGGDWIEQPDCMIQIGDKNEQD